MTRPCGARASRFSITVTESLAEGVRIIEQNEETGNCAERRNHFVRSLSLWCIRSIFKVEPRLRTLHGIPVLNFLNKVQLFVDIKLIRLFSHIRSVYVACTFLHLAFFFLSLQHSNIIRLSRFKCKNFWWFQATRTDLFLHSRCYIEFAEIFVIHYAVIHELTESSSSKLPFCATNRRKWTVQSS